jgi:uracil phosphoribosyltransferase
LVVFDLSKQNSVASIFLSEVRDVQIQTDRLRFRKNLTRLGEVLAYEMSKRLDYQDKTITTPLSDIVQSELQEQPVLISILRAGMPFFEGVQNFFDHADCGFVGAYRSPAFAHTNQIQSDYFAVPDLMDKTVVLIDPMLATGRSIVTTLERLKKYGQPRSVILMAMIAAPEGIDYIESVVDGQLSLWCVAVDKELNDRAYIVPGLGDAGDLAYGVKM